MNEELHLTPDEWEEMKRIDAAWDRLSTVAGLAILRALLGQTRFELYINAVTKRKKLEVRILGIPEQVTFTMTA